MRELVDERRRQVSPEIVHLVRVGGNRHAVVIPPDVIPRAVSRVPAGKVVRAEHNDRLSPERRRVGLIGVRACTWAVVTSLKSYPLANLIIGSPFATVKLSETKSCFVGFILVLMLSIHV